MSHERPVEEEAKRAGTLVDRDREPTNMRRVSIRDEGEAMIREEKASRRGKVSRRNPLPLTIQYIDEKSTLL